jgi:hypothetical protein
VYQLVICEPLKLVYRPLPKCASTSMIKLFEALGGISSSTSTRDSLAIASLAGPTPSAKCYVIRCRDSEVDQLVGRFAGYRWISVVRDPYQRLVSNYWNKLNRYARRLEPKAYWLSLIAQFSASPRHWRSPTKRRESIQSRIPFERFVLQLQRSGIRWDVHYRRQADMLLLDRLSYDHLVQMESLDTQLPTAFEGLGEAVEWRPAISRIGRLNASMDQRSLELWTPVSRQAATAMYWDDFAPLGYTPDESFPRSMAS